jgi:two-component system, cell cycle sensor histidine kinase and response regulator CckA
MSTKLGRVLIVDDEEPSMSAVRDRAKELGYEAEGFTTAQAALQALGDQDFDVLLTDLTMPDMDGLALLRAAVEIDPDLVGIVMTGLDTVQTAADAMRSGVFDHILKPLDLNNVLPVLTRAMEMRRLRLENARLRATVAAYELGRAVASTLELNTIPTRVVDAVAQHTQADSVSLLMPAPTSDELYVAAVRGPRSENRLGHRVSMQQGTAGWVARHHKPIIHDTSMWVPLLSSGKLQGVLYIEASRRLRPFIPGKLEALNVLVSVAAPALENAGLYTQLREAEKEYRSIFENAVEGIFRIGADGRFEAANPALAAMLGFDGPDEMLGRQGNDALCGSIPTPADPTPDAGLGPQFQEQGFADGFECEIGGKDNRRVWVSETMRAVRDEQGRLLCYEGSLRDITERKRAEEALVHEGDLLHALMDNLPDAIYFKDVDGRFTRVNRTQAEILGVSSPEEAVGKTDFDYFTPEYARDAHADERRIVDTGLPLSGKLEHVRRANGEYCWMTSTKAAIQDHGSIAGIVGVSRDITELREAEQALRRERDFTSRIMQTVPSGIAVVDSTGKIVLANAQAGRVLGLPIEAVLQRSLDAPDWHLADPAGQPLPDEALSAFLTRGAVGPGSDARVAIGRPDGQRVILSLHGTPLTDEGGTPDGAVFSIEDITERKQAEEALASEHRMLRTLIDALPDHIYVKDPDGRILLINEAQARAFGLNSPDEAIGKTDLELGPADLAAQYRTTELAVIQLGQSVAVEEPYVTPTGEKRVVSTIKAPLRDTHGDIVGLVGLSRDITDQKQLEAQFLQAQKMETVGRLAGGLAHDFNNLLTAVLGYGSLVKRKLPARSMAHPDIDEVMRAAQRAAGLTRQLLAFSRKQVIEQTVIDLNQLLLGMDRLLRHLIGEDVDLVTVQGQGLGAVKADPGQIEQVLVNLAVNARDAMPTGGRLTIETANLTLDANYLRTHAGPAPGEYVMLAVSDTGAGMTDEVKAHLFEPFYTTKATGKGSGLGLATVYGIVEQHGGHIWVYSEPGQGTTFKIYLPRVQAAACAAQREEATLGSPPRGTETVLVVEDERMVRDFAARSLTELGYVVLAAADGGEALQVAREHTSKIDLLLTEMVMPKMSGTELAFRLKDSCPHLAILYTSGYTDSAVVHQGALGERVAFLQKPFTTATLACKVHEVLHGASGG